MKTPILDKKISPFSKDISNTFVFFYNDVEQIIENNLVIEDAENNSVVYNSSIKSFNLFHKVSENTLENGKLYRCKIRIKGVSGSWSEFSDSVLFFVLAKPRIIFKGIDFQNQNKIYNQKPFLEATYYHENNEQLQVYAYYLYDDNKNLIKKYPDVLYYGNGSLSQQLDSLESSRVYYIELRTLSVNKQEFSTGLISIVPIYDTPKLSGTISAKSIENKGAIEVEANIMQIIGYYKDVNGNIHGDFKYINNESVDLTNGAKIGFVQNVDIPSDFIFQIWCDNLVENRVFLTLFSEYTTVEFYKYKRRIHAECKSSNTNITSHFVSNIAPSKNKLVINAKLENNTVEIEVV